MNVVLMAETLVAICLVLANSAIIFAVVAGAAPIDRRGMIDCVAAPTTGDEGPDRWLYRFVPLTVRLCEMLMCELAQQTLITVEVKKVLSRFGGMTS